MCWEYMHVCISVWCMEHMLVCDPAKIRDKTLGGGETEIRGGEIVGETLLQDTRGLHVFLSGILIGSGDGRFDMSGNAGTDADDPAIIEFDKCHVVVYWRLLGSDDIEEIVHRVGIADIIPFQSDVILLVYHSDDAQRRERRPLVEILEYSGRSDFRSVSIVKLVSKILDKFLDFHFIQYYLIISSFASKISEADPITYYLLLITYFKF